MFLEVAQKYTTVEVQINSATAKHNLPNDDILREKKVTGIFIQGRNSAGNGKSPLNRTLVSDQAIAEGYLNFECDNASVMEQIPLAFLKVDPSDKRVLKTDLVGITPTKSFITFADTTSISAGQSVVIGIFYED